MRELKTRISRLSDQKLKITPIKIILNSAQNMNNMKSEKYGLSLEEIEKRSLSGEQFKTLFNMHRIEKTKLLHDRLDRYDQKKYYMKRRRLRDNLNISEKVLVLAEEKKRNLHQENSIISLFKTFLILTKRRQGQCYYIKLYFTVAIYGKKKVKCLVHSRNVSVYIQKAFW